CAVPGIVTNEGHACRQKARPDEAALFPGCFDNIALRIDEFCQTVKRVEFIDVVLAGNGRRKQDLLTEAIKARQSDVAEHGSDQRLLMIEERFRNWHDATDRFAWSPSESLHMPA